MFRQIRGKFGLILAVISAAIVGGATTAVVLAAVPDTSGVIHACYKTGTTGLFGTSIFRVIDTATTPNCANGETALTWNQTGPQGPAGSPGPQGPAGVGGAQIAYAAFKPDSTLEPTYSRGVNDAVIIPQYQDDGRGGQRVIGYVGCFNVSFTPKIGLLSLGSNGEVPSNILVKGRSTDVARINTDCGAGYNAETVSVNINSLTTPDPSYSYSFFN